MGLLFKLASKIWCHFVSDYIRTCTKTCVAICFRKTSVYWSGFYIRVCNSSKNTKCFFMFGALLKATKSFFKKGMPFCRSICVTKDMKLLAFIFEQPSYSKTKNVNIPSFHSSHHFNSQLKLKFRQSSFVILKRSSYE